MSRTSFKNTERLNAYRLMWIIILFDLPTQTAAERKVYAEFRKNILELGFSMFQFSIYTRSCPSKEHAEVQVRKVEKILPARGKIGILSITDKQFAMMKLYYGKASVPVPEGYEQLLLF
jgi:CRISPR-associated protein Cas2